MKLALSDSLEIERISKSFAGSQPVLDEVDLSVPAGSSLALLGPSGCGKTTLLRVISGLERPDGGTVRLGDRVLTDGDRFVPPEDRHVGMVFQDWALFAHLSVARNVGFGLARKDRRDSPRIDESLRLVGMADFAERVPETLSGGQQQRVALARALAPRPSVLLLDEPFSNLDATLRAAVRTEVGSLLRGLGITTVFVTHDQDEAFVLGDRVAVMRDGAIAQVGAAVDVYERPVDRWVAGFVGSANFVRGTAVAGGRGIATALGTVRSAAAAVGELDVLVRPEHVMLEPLERSLHRIPGDDVADPPDSSVPAADDPANRGRVMSVEYVGHATRYQMHLHGFELLVSEQSTPRFSEGDIATVLLMDRSYHALGAGADGDQGGSRDSSASATTGGGG